MKIVIIFFIFISFFPIVNASWDLTLNSNIVGEDFTAFGQFIAGTNELAEKTIDYFDGRLITNPSHSTSLYSIVSDEYLMVDYRPILLINNPEKWEITQKGSREFRSTGYIKERLTWDIGNLPKNVEIILVDYGSDSNKETVVNRIDLRRSSSYEFHISNLYGEYRYFDLILTLFNGELNSNNIEPNYGGGRSTTSQIKQDEIIYLNSEYNLENNIYNSDQIETIFLINDKNSNNFITGAIIGGESNLFLTILFVLFVLILFFLLKKQNYFRGTSIIKK